MRTPFPMSQPARPVFPKRTVNIREYGAVADGKTLCTAAIARAVEACAQAGGGRVLVTAGIWLTGAIYLKSNIELHSEKGRRVAVPHRPERLFTGGTDALGRV